MADEVTKNRVWINPCDCGCDCEDDQADDIYNLSYELPGVDKEDIDLKITKQGLKLLAVRNNIEYYNEFNFSCDAEEDKVQAVYANGLLSVRVPLNCPDPFKEAKTVKISG
jgi:HSP20 family protein